VFSDGREYVMEPGQEYSQFWHQGSQLSNKMQGQGVVLHGHHIFERLNDVIELLQQIGAVSNENEFLKDWLYSSEFNLRTLNFKRVKPSAGMLAICAQITALWTLYDSDRTPYAAW
jgi:hypothetical protein